MINDVSPISASLLHHTSWSFVRTTHACRIETPSGHLSFILTTSISKLWALSYISFPNETLNSLFHSFYNSMWSTSGRGVNWTTYDSKQHQFTWNTDQIPSTLRYVHKRPFYRSTTIVTNFESSLLHNSNYRHSLIKFKTQDLIRKS